MAEAGSINNLCGSMEKSSLSPGGGAPELDPGQSGTRRTAEGATKGKRSLGGWAEDGDTEDRGGWEKGTPAWKKAKHKRGWRGGRGQKKRSSVVEDDDDDASPDYVPNKRRPDSRMLRKETQPRGVYTQPDQKARGTGHKHHDATVSCRKPGSNVLCVFPTAETISRIRSMKLDIEGDPS